MAEDTNAAGPLAVLRRTAAYFRETERALGERLEAVGDALPPSAAEELRAQALMNSTKAEACEVAAADLEALIAAAGKRERPAVTQDDRKAVFMAGFSMGHQRGFYMETEGGLAIWPDHLPVPPGAEEAWAAVASAIAKGGVRG